MADDLKIENMSVDDLRAILLWAADEGWNPGVADAEAFFAADPGGFFVARLDGVPVAAISVVNHDPAHAFLGLYICRPEHRGRGFGMRIWAHGLEHAGARSVGLDGVPAQEDNYRKSGFVRRGQTLRYVGRIEPRTSPNVRLAVRGDTQRLVAMDEAANGFERRNFMAAWVTPVPEQRETRLLIANGQIRGLATWRACLDGTKIGPVIAEDSTGALELIADIAAIRTGGPLIVDVPERNHTLCAELETLGFNVPFVTARMYRGPAPDPHPSLQSIATMELG